MAEISLKEYLSRVDNLLKEQASDQVIHHCRHILQYFPKNVAAYRSLGVALADRSRWNDVVEVFRRVLSAIPDDEAAHLGLCEAYEHTGKHDDAIWHLERAFEQEPNNDEIINKLRELYLQRRNVEYPKVQLTAGAVARQYARNGLYDQAMNTLYQALERTPDRYDLRLLLAQMMWDSGYRVDAAEMALDVLRVLPDCLSANRILTELWLSEGRPSDAQRYLSRIEALDPYLALELAHGQPPPDDVLRIQELDYERAAKRELTTSTPDWLGELGSDSADWMASFKQAPAQEAEAETPMSDLLETPLPDDWLTDLGSEIAEPPPASTVPPPRSRTGITGLLAGLDAPEPGAPAEPEALPDAGQLPVSDLFATAADEQADSDAILDLFPTEADAASGEVEVADLFEEPQAAQPAQPGAPADADPLAWLHQSGVELVENAETEVPDLFGADEEFVLQEPDQADPLAWLGDYGEAVPAESSGAQARDEEADPLAWLHQSGVETVDQESASRETPAEPTMQAGAQEDALLDWLADESVLDEILDMESLSTGTLKAVHEEQPIAEEDAFAAVEVEAIEEVEMSENEEFNPLGEQPAADDSDLDWLSAPQEETAEPVADMADWLTAAAPVGETPADVETPPSADSDLDWMVEPEAQADIPDWMAETSASPEASIPVDESGGEWTPDDQASPADTPDWLAEMAPANPEAQPSDAAADWLSGAESAGEPQAEQAGDTAFDWLSASAETPEAEAAAPQPASEFERMGEAGSDEQPAAETPEWLSQMEPAESPEAPSAEESDFEWIADQDVEPAAATETPEWLSELGTAGEATGEPAQTDAGFERASDTEPVEMPDWLAASAPEASAEPQAEPAADAGFEWMSAAEDSGEPEIEAADTPGWLSEIAPAEISEQAGEIEPEAAPDWQSQTEPAADAEFEWLSSDESEPATAGDSPDWLAEMSPAQETEQTADTGFEWIPDAEPEAPSPAAEAPGWFSEIPASAETETAAEASFEWASDVQPEAAPSAESGLEWASEVESQPEAATPADAPDWLAELGPSDQEPESIPAEDAPGWLADIAPAGEPTAAETEEEAEVVAGDMPDWLAAMAPSQESDAYPETEFEPEETETDWEAEPVAADDQPEWLSSLKSEAAEPPQPVTATSEFSWLNEMNTPEEPMAELEGADYVDSSDLEDVPTAPAPAENAPDWLNAMVPGLDVDYEAPEDAPIETEYIESPAARREEAAAPASPPARDFEWLNQIVAEEALQPGQQPAAQRRFVFSRQPAWLRQPVEQSATAPQRAVDEDDSLPGWLQDDDADDKDFDLPPWLQ